MDLLGGLDLGPSSSPAILENKPVAMNTVDLLGDIFGATPAPIQAAKQEPANNLYDQAKPKSYQVYNSNGMNINIQCKKESNSSTLMKVIFNSSATIENLIFQVAVPKVVLFNGRV
jgi:hypothetical protein